MYPWSGFGTILFQRTEQPIFGTDAGWNRSEPTVARSRPLGSATDSIATLAVGSATRTFDIYMEPSRVQALEALVGTTALFTDWGKPSPDSRMAFLLSVSRGESVTAMCAENGTRLRYRVTVSLVSQ